MARNRQWLVKEQKLLLHPETCWSLQQMLLKELCLHTKRYCTTVRHQREEEKK